MLTASVQRDTGFGLKKVKGCTRAGGVRYFPQLGSTSYLHQWYGQDPYFLLGQHVLSWGTGRTICDVTRYHFSLGEACSAVRELKTETGLGGGFVGPCSRLFPAAALAPLPQRCRIRDVVRSDSG